MRQPPKCGVLAALLLALIARRTLFDVPHRPVGFSDPAAWAVVALDGACGSVGRDGQAGAGEVNRTQNVTASGITAIS